MSEETKFFVRPKVRFCQIDKDESMKKELENSAGSKCENKPSNKPKVKSVVTLDKPIRLVKLNKTPDRQEFNDCKIIDNAQSMNPLSSNSPMHSSFTTQTPASLNVNPSKAETEPPLNDVNNTQNIKANSKQVNIQSIPTKSTRDHTISLSVSKHRDEGLHEVSKVKDCAKSIPSKKDCTKVKKGKENETTVTKKAIQTTAMKSSDLSTLKSKTRFSSAGTSAKAPNVTSKPVISDRAKKNPNSKPIVIGIMPCYKHKTVAAKAKTPPVKKTVIRNIIGPTIKPCIGPGISRKTSDSVKLRESGENVHTKPIISGEKLARPEYNSIMCTINKLNEMKKQKVVTDVEHLPPEYKNLINEKISTALDFPLDEAIYKNLVDLTIDENQLPCRLTRSKDPEPRQRDMVPVLSDFFTPAPTEEYCTSVSIKPRTSESVDSWNAFRISDQICEWKYILDHV